MADYQQFNNPFSVRLYSDGMGKDISVFEFGHGLFSI